MAPARTGYANRVAVLADVKTSPGRPDESGEESWETALGGTGWWVAGATVLFAAVFAARQASNSAELALSVLYLLPIAVLALRFGLRGGLAGVVVASALLTADTTEIPALGILTRISAYLLVAFGFGLASDRIRRLTEELRAAVHERDRNYWHLRRVAEVLPVCMDCGDVREGHEWTDVSDYMRRNASFASHGLCPSCEARRHAELDGQDALELSTK